MRAVQPQEGQPAPPGDPHAPQAPASPPGPDGLHPDRRAADPRDVGAVPPHGLEAARQPAVALGSGQLLRFLRSDSARCFAVAVGFGLTLGLLGALLGFGFDTPFLAGLAGAVAGASEPDDRRLGAFVTLAPRFPRPPQQRPPPRRSLRPVRRLPASGPLPRPRSRCCSRTRPPAPRR